jgi:UDP-N-acetylmuramoyl-tripeptide--D-alanyl-D-alanine ligase
VGRLVADLSVDRLLVVGEQAAPIHQAATAAANWGGVSVLVSDQEAAVDALRRELRPGDVVLVKGSRYRTWEVADALRAEAVRPEATPGGGVPA